MKTPTSSYSDAELYAMLRESAPRRNAAFAELYNRHGRRVYLYCKKSIGKSNADDVFQEVFLRFLASAEYERPMTNVPAYLLRIARNLCLNFKNRRHLPAQEFDETAFERHDPLPDAACDAAELDRMVEAALELLPDDHRDAFVLQQYCGMSYEEIGVEQDVPISTVRNRIVRAKKRLREILAGYLAEFTQR